MLSNVIVFVGFKRIINDKDVRLRGYRRLPFYILFSLFWETNDLFRTIEVQKHFNTV